MAPNRRYANYPGAQRAPRQPKAEEAPKDDQNPTLRGHALTVAGKLAANLGFVRRYFWHNAKFGLIREIPELRDYKYRLQPDVIPLRDGTPVPDLLHFGPELTAPTPPDAPRGYMTCADYHALYASGTVTPYQVVSALMPLTRRGQRPKGKYETAWVPSHGNGEALALAAAQASTARWLAGKPLGILDGVPISVKDEIDVRGWVSHSGMKYNPRLKFFQPAEETSWPIRKLEAAGAVVVGKNNMHELRADTCGCNPNWGTPTNWHNPKYYPGGSSSGGASAVCCGMVPIAIGTDAGGGIRIPAAFTGLYALKPTHHRTVVMKHSSCVTGPMAASVADLTIAYRIMSQPNPDDPVQSLFTPSIPMSLDPNTANRRRVLAVDSSWWSQADKEVVAHCDKALAYFCSVGYSVLDINLPYLRECQLAHSVLTITQTYHDVREAFPPPGRFFDHISAQSRLFLAVASQTPTADFRAAGRLRQLIMSHLAHLFEQYPGILFLTPTTPTRGWRRDEGDAEAGFTDVNASIRNMIYIFLANLTGCPAVSVPVGYANAFGGSKNGTRRLPIGMHAMAEWGGEEQLLEFAREAEVYLNTKVPGGRVIPEGWVDVAEAAAKKSKVESDNASILYNTSVKSMKLRSSLSMMSVSTDATMSP
ncbi:amidase [Sodiomyces alkalinus F11]|uniref:Amidase n=1 Tax=Sodiomyces alkalinus (strain CBS 110278 / VKM F-3762 / F11) TaxID=1314773 RepID=A0A3N2PYG1_SODAK|nr:amidase [Sodiomyces alkalinus F11]ROT39537.1 amidase [Sodiomyces alkalinus F11]